MSGAFGRGKDSSIGRPEASGTAILCLGLCLGKGLQF